MNIANVTKNMFFWACILVLSALLQKVLPFPGIPAWESLPLYVTAIYVWFRGTCTIINNMCVWILVKWGDQEEEPR
jgi:hypothetical protein